MCFQFRQVERAGCLNTQAEMRRNEKVRFEAMHKLFESKKNMKYSRI
jgi:hypothetical protein